MKSETPFIPPPIDLSQWFGNIDIYLFDQFLKGRFHPDMKVLDAGCGYGRNLIYFMRAGYNVYGLDQSAEAVSHVQELAKDLSELPAEHFKVADLTIIPFDDGFFDLVVSSAVLHFAKDETHFNTMLNELIRVIKPGGLFFARLASNIGIESKVQPLGGRRYHLPDGSDRFLVDEAMLIQLQVKLGLDQIEPIKTSNVQNQRCMTTWVCRKK